MVAQQPVDRLVKIVAPTDLDVLPDRFSECLGFETVVLLGDPGSGKSHLFREYAAASGAQILSVRDFLNMPIGRIRKGDALFLDGLDEQRSGSHDANVVNAVVSRLWEVMPSRLRISCRAADWLAASDLATFRSLLSELGGFVVASLQPMTADEQLVMLGSLREADPAGFLSEARSRGVEAMLGNPQTLLMLRELVLASQWPSSRLDLFESSVRLMLSEHGADRAPSESTDLSAEELLPIAGLICAVRLIADISEISLSASSADKRRPSYRAIDPDNPQRVLAALQRRLFVYSGAAHSVDYVHRTVAEFAAATYIAGQLLTGASVRRIMEMLTIGNVPATELRGLCGWLAVMAPQLSDALFAADPLGVLLYADVNDLPVGRKRALLGALEARARVDPSFHNALWDESFALGSLVSVELIPEIAQGLRGPNESYRYLLLKCLASGPPLSDLREDLREILAMESRGYGERHFALLALLNRGSQGIATAAGVLAGLSKGDVRVRAEIIERCHEYIVDVTSAAVDLLVDCRNDESGISGLLYGVPEALSPSDLHKVLNQYSELARNLQKASRKDGSWEVLRFIQVAVAKCLALAEPATGAEVVKWMRAARSSDPYGYSGNSPHLNALLKSDEKLARDMMRVALDEALEADETAVYSAYHEIQELFAGPFPHEVLIDVLFDGVKQGDTRPKARASQYALALQVASGSESTASRYWALYDWADVDVSLLAVREQETACVVPEWRLRDAVRQKTAEKERENSWWKAREGFLQSKGVIQTGAHRGWMGAIANVYFGLYSDLDHVGTPLERLEKVYGLDCATVAIDGLKEFVRRGDADICLEHIVEVAAEEKYYVWWYAIVAGLDELSKDEVCTERIAEPMLLAAVAVDCVHPTFNKDGSTTTPAKHVWLDQIWARKPQLAVRAYAALAHQSFRNKSKVLKGVHELTNATGVSAHVTPVVTGLLREFPACELYGLRNLLTYAIKHVPQEALAEIASAAVHREDVRDQPAAHAMWLATCLFATASNCIDVDGVSDDAQASLVWALRDLMGDCRSDSASSRLSSGQLAYIARYIAKRFPRSEPPQDGWSGDRNSWDATEAVGAAIGLLSGDPSADAGRTLASLQASPEFSSYSYLLGRAISDQRIARVDALYERPTFEVTLGALKSKCPASASDLRAHVMDLLEEVGRHVRHGNVDSYKRFWSENTYGKITTPKPEDSCRDALIDLLRWKLESCGFSVDPEGHMSLDKRCDIVVQKVGVKAVLELKRDRHDEVWTAAVGQLDRFYTRDPEAGGFGILVVFWFGDPRSCPAPPKGTPRPTSPSEMRDSLLRLIPESDRSRLDVYVLDVSSPAQKN